MVKDKIPPKNATLEMNGAAIGIKHAFMHHLA